MPARAKTPDKLLLKAGLIGAVGLAVLSEAPPLWVAGYDALSIAACCGLIYAVPPLLARGLLSLANALDTMAAKIPARRKDMAQFAKSIRELKGRARFPKHAPYWGTLKGKPIFADLESNGLILGPAGTAKDTSQAGPTICALATTGAGIVTLDLKGDMAVIYGPILRKMGYKVVNLNFGGLFLNRAPGTAYNQLSVISDSFRNLLADIDPDSREMSLQLYPEPKSEGEGGNKFFRNGSRKIIVFCMIMLVIIEGESATLGDVLILLQDRKLLRQYARWAEGTLEQPEGGLVRLPLHECAWAHDGTHDPEEVARFAEFLGGLGASIAELMKDGADSRTFDSFIEGAIGEMADFNITTRAFAGMQAGEFRFSELKESKQPVAVFIMGDTSRPDAYRKVIEITTSNMFKALMRAKANRRKVYVVGNEITNYLIARIKTLQTTLRAYEVVCLWYVQSLAAYRSSYSKDDLQTLLSETEIKYILPGQRDPETLKMLEELLGKKKIIKRSNSGTRRDGADGLSGLDGFTYAEETAPLMSADQIRRSKKGILLLGNNKPALIDTPSIASIWPFRHWQAISPFYDKPYRERVRLVLWRYLPMALWLLFFRRRDKQ